MGGCFVPLLVLGLWLGGAFGSKFPPPKMMQRPPPRVVPASKTGPAVAPVKEPPPTEFLVADSVFEEAGGTGSRAIPLSKLSKYLTQRGDMPLAKVQEMLNALDTNGDGTIDLNEWRAGFTSGLLGQPLPAAQPRTNAKEGVLTDTPVEAMS